MIAVVLADPALAATDEVVLFLPPAFGVAANVCLLTDFARTMAPALGWVPAELPLTARRREDRSAIWDPPIGHGHPVVPLA